MANLRNPPLVDNNLHSLRPVRLPSPAAAKTREPGIIRRSVTMLHRRYDDVCDLRHARVAGSQGIWISGAGAVDDGEEFQVADVPAYWGVVRC